MDSEANKTIVIKNQFSTGYVMTVSPLWWWKSTQPMTDTGEQSYGEEAACSKQAYRL